MVIDNITLNFMIHYNSYFIGADCMSIHNKTLYWILCVKYIGYRYLFYITN